MLSWLSENIGTIIVAAVILAVVILIIATSARRRKKKGSTCGCGCESCAMSEYCKEKKK